MTTVLLLTGGALGAVLRYLIDRRIQGWHDSPFPWGTLTVNITGSLILAVLTGATLFGHPAPLLHASLGTGLCGALTTYSTLGYETVRLATEGSRAYALANITTNILAGLGATTLGLLLAATIWT